MNPDNAKVIMEFVADCIDREAATTKKVLASVPEGKGDYCPDPKSMKSLDLAWHIASAELFFMKGIADGAFVPDGSKRPEELSTGAKIADWYAAQTPKASARLKAMNGEDCAKILDFMGMFQMPAFAFAQISLTHAIHHRGQLAAYLRPMGAKVPGIYGPSGDEPLAAKA